MGKKEEILVETNDPGPVHLFVSHFPQPPVRFGV